MMGVTLSRHWVQNVILKFDPFNQSTGSYVNLCTFLFEISEI